MRGAGPAYPRTQAPVDSILEDHEGMQKKPGPGDYDHPGDHVPMPSFEEHPSHESHAAHVQHAKAAAAAAAAGPPPGLGMLGPPASPEVISAVSNHRLLQLLAQKVDEIAGQVHDVHQCVIRSYQNTTDYIRDQHEITRFRAMGVGLPHAPVSQSAPPPPINQMVAMQAAPQAKKRSSKSGRAERSKEMKKNISGKMDTVLVKALKLELGSKYVEQAPGSHREKARIAIDSVAKGHPKEFEDFCHAVQAQYDYSRKDIIWTLEEKGINTLKNARTRKRKERQSQSGSIGSEDSDDDDDESHHGGHHVHGHGHHGPDVTLPHSMLADKDDDVEPGAKRHKV